MILLNEITIKDFLSHEKTQISFDENEKLLIDGRSGSGKSSITEAILWCLYGKGRSDNRSLVRRGTKTATVSLKLTNGSTETVITRSVSSAGKNTLTITQNTGSKGQFLPIERVGLKDTQDWIEGVFLKASYELFTNSVAYPQENENSFVKANAGRRKDLLLEIVQATNFDELYDKARRAITANELDNATAVAKVESTEQLIKNAEETASKYDFYKKENDDVSGKIGSFVLLEKDLEKQINGVSGISRQIEDKKTTKRILTNAFATANNQLEKDQKILNDYVPVDIEVAKKNVLEAETLGVEVEKIEKELRDAASMQMKINSHLANKPAINDYTNDIETLNKRLIPLIKDAGKCPAGDACPFILPIKGQIEFLTQQISEKTSKGIWEKAAYEEWDKQYRLFPTVDTTASYAKLGELKSKIKILLESKDLITKHERFELVRKEIQDREVKLKEEKTQIFIELTSIETQIKSLEQELVKTDINKINSDLATLRLTLQTLEKTKNETALGMALATKAQEAIKDASTGLVELKKGIIKAQEEKESLELLKEALSPRGIKAVVIDYLVPQLEERINKVLGQMSDFRIRLDTQKALIDEEGMKEGLFITVLNDSGEELPFASYSGGEKVKITIAISEALASLMNQIGFRIMDENIVSLDRESTEGFVEVLTKLQDKFPQLLVISHLQEVKDIFEKQIMITKINGVSKII